MHQALTERLNACERQLTDFLADLWREYLGAANTELIDYARLLARGIAPGSLSNSFVGARARDGCLRVRLGTLVDEVCPLAQ